MRRFFIALIGGTVVLVGIALLILPGPGVVIAGRGAANRFHRRPQGRAQVPPSSNQSGADERPQAVLAGTMQKEQEATKETERPARCFHVFLRHGGDHRPVSPPSAPRT